MTTFSPSTISNLALWLDASDRTKITLSGTNVTLWSDKSGNNRNMSNIGSVYTSTLNSLSTIYFDNSRLSNASFPWRTNFTQFWVAYGPTMLISHWNTGYVSYVYAGNWNLTLINGGFNVNDSVSPQGTSVVPANSWYIMTFGYNNGTTATPYAVNGTTRTSASGTATGDATPTASLILNGNGSGSTGPYQFAEFLHYNTNLTTSQYQSVEGYLAWKWGLQGNLPSSHPYKTMAPFNSIVSPIASIPSSSYIVPVNTYSTIKTFNLPVASTTKGQMIIFKDYLGYANSNPIYLSTIGLDRIERSNVSSMVLSNAYGAWTFANDGITNWFLLDAYKNTLSIRSRYVNIPYPTGAASVYTLGAYNISPWGVSAANWPNSSSANLQWIWFTANAQSSAPATATYFYRNFTNTSPGTFRFYVIADDYSTIYYTTDGNNFTNLGNMNGGWGSAPSPSMTFSLPEGNIQFRIWASNGGGPAGILMTLYNPSSNVVLESDSSWYYNAT